MSTYIHLNPFRAELCGAGFPKPLESHRWSSYPAYVGKAIKRPEWLVREKVLKSWGFREGASGSLSGYKDKMERRMNFELKPDAGRRGEFEKQIKSGWCLGSAEFRARILEMLEGKSKGDNYRGIQRRAHNEEMAEHLLRRGLEVLDLTEEELFGMKSASPQKQALAWLLKTHTSVTGVWVARRLRMGHRSNLSRALQKFGKPKEAKMKSLKRKMIQCTG